MQRLALHALAMLIPLGALGCTTPFRLGDGGGSDGGGVDAFRSDSGPTDAFRADTGRNDVGAGEDAYTPPAPTSFAFTGALDFYTVPPGVTTIDILAEGASGGDADGAVGTAPFPGGHGARIAATFTVTPGEVLAVMVGEQPASIVFGSDGCGGSGGGGTFVAREGGPLVAVGGGGGASAFNVYARPGGDANTGSDGFPSGAFAGGVGGGGGAAPTMEGGGGGGLNGDGSNGEGLGGFAFATGGAGGVRAVSESCIGANGGFGGGGGGGNDLGAGGGGYSGGAGQSDLGETMAPAGGGGSFADPTATDVMISVRADHGHGQVVISPR